MAAASPANGDEAVRVAVGCIESDWAAIKAAGRQGVRRAFREGGARKGKLKMAKMQAAAAAASADGGGSGGAVSGAAGEVRRAKKRRRRANAQERVDANSHGQLTPVQLCVLFATERASWERINAWLRPLLPPDGALHRHPQRKERLREHWAAELRRFGDEFAAQLPASAAADGATAAPAAILPPLALFISTVSPVLADIPDEAVAERLWRVLETEQLLGEQLGGVLAPVPLAEGNIGLQMLRAMGWMDGQVIFS